MSEGRKGKRRHGDAESAPTRSVTADVSSDSPVTQSFLIFRAEMDSHQDKHERLFKISRDITIISKRIIFNLHRTVGKII